MSKLRSATLSLVAVTATAMIAVSAASALPVFREAGVNLTAAKAVTASGGASTLESIIGGKRAVITCEEVTGTGTIEAASKGTASLEFKKNCAIAEVSTAGVKAAFENCTVTEPIAATAAEVLKNWNTGKFTGGGAEELFATIELKVCALKGKYKTKGATLCSASLAEVEALSHLLTCTGAGSELKLGAEEAAFFGSFTVSKATGNWSDH